MTRAIVLDEADEARVFHAVALIGGDGEDDALGDGDGRVEVDLVVRLAPASARTRVVRCDFARQRAGLAATARRIAASSSLRVKSLVRATP